MYSLLPYFMKPISLDSLEQEIITQLVKLGAAVYNKENKLGINQAKATQLIPYLLPKNTVFNMFWVYQLLFLNIEDSQNSLYLNVYEFLFILENTLRNGNFYHVNGISYNSPGMSQFDNPYREDWDERIYMYGYYLIIVENNEDTYTKNKFSFVQN